MILVRIETSPDDFHGMAVSQGIGLCRTEHMFREGERLEIVRGAILVANQATRAKAKAAMGEALNADELEAVATFDVAMAKLEQLQQGDFEGIFEAMDSLPVVIRLIDPPLHEFLPNLEEQLVKVTKAGDAATQEDRVLLATIRSLHEQNPMLGLRGCRLGLMIPDFVKIQTRAILNAQIAVDTGRSTKPDIELGICGEHGGDPESIAKCERIGLDYVSCSPFRVPVARLAAAQAAMAGAAERDK